MAPLARPSGLALGICSTSGRSSRSASARAALANDPWICANLLVIVSIGVRSCVMYVMTRRSSPTVSVPDLTPMVPTNRAVAIPNAMINPTRRSWYFCCTSQLDLPRCHPCRVVDET